MDGGMGELHWSALRALLPVYQAITTVSLGDGAMTSFWSDVWLGDECLAERFPSLLSADAHTGLTVEGAVRHGLRRHLVSRAAHRGCNTFLSEQTSTSHQPNEQAGAA
jgi:hypothetical protein